MKTFQQNLRTNSIAYSGMAINVPVAIAEIEDKRCESFDAASLVLWLAHFINGAKYYTHVALLDYSAV